jgi:Fe-S oxidoreductase
MERIKDDTLCCGAGSWMKTAYPDFAQFTAQERLTEAESTNAEALVTYCPHCEENFGDAIGTRGSSMKIYNLLDLVFEAL